ncbi:hypothetical protein B0H14DRAFT_2618184 [Mycena olivaceomarginata]|nr:hypothetical protein B0H14DRAFT_2618184 [Mycena olivaceomarginata]
MPKVADKVASQTTAAPATEDECLYLPSDFSSVERQQLELTILAVEESRWREGQVFDILRALQGVVKAISALRNRKGKNDRQQKQNSHTPHGVVPRIPRISLNGFSTFPILTESDLFMKSVQQKRHVGDSKCTDGLLFRATALRTIGSYDKDGDIDMEDSTISAEGSPKAPKPKTRDVSETAPDRPEGWLWQLGKLTSMTDAEMDAWAVEDNYIRSLSLMNLLNKYPGDRVQWFCYIFCGLGVEWGYIIKDSNGNLIWWRTELRDKKLIKPGARQSVDHILPVSLQPIPKQHRQQGLGAGSL